MSKVTVLMNDHYRNKIADSIMNKEIEQNLEAAVRDYDQMQAATNAFYNDLIFGPAIAINKAIDEGVAANDGEGI